MNQEIKRQKESVMHNNETIPTNPPTTRDEELFRVLKSKMTLVIDNAK
jgi:hypothetical protein